MKPAVLFVSYDGMLEPLGQSQVLSYLERLSDEFEIHLISFEKSADLADEVKLARVKDRIATAGIAWKPLRYHRSPSAPATAYDIAQGTLAALAIVRRHNIGIFHARSYVPALMALAVTRMTGAKFLFDMRGFWADERVDGGIWAADSSLFTTAKSLERRFLQSADHVVSLTHAAAAEIERFPYLRGCVPPISVIPTCADLRRFSAGKKDATGPLTVGYVGAAGTWQLFDGVLAFYNVLRRIRPEARLLVVNRDDHDYVRERLAAAAVPDGSVDLRAAEHSEVPSLVSRMSVGTALRKPLYSQLACAPTKLAEYLGCGVPCLVNTGVGDVREIVGHNRVGVVLEDFSEAHLEEGAQRLLALLEDGELSQRCVETAWRLFSLDDGVSAYRAIYRQLAAMPDEERAAA
jgi:glycosyltransferase involved in cell wall biosynthesis